MLRNLRSRRRPRYGTHVCSLIAALLLLLSVVLLHSRLSSDRHSPHPRQHQSDEFTFDPLLEEADPDDRNSSEDRIDELDDGVQEDSDPRVQDEDDILGDLDVDEDENDQSRVSKYYFDHVQGVIRRAFDKRSIDQWEDYASFDSNWDSTTTSSNLAFSSDDVALDDNVRRKVAEVKGIEDALLLKVGHRVSPLREGWGHWFERKSDFLRRDRMFKSNLELLNPLHNPFLQDPDGAGVTGLTKGDKLVQKRIIHEFKKVPFTSKKPLGVSDYNSELKSKEKKKLLEDAEGMNFKVESVDEGSKNEMKIAERRTLDDNDSSRAERIQQIMDKSSHFDGHVGIRSKFSGQIYADGKRWGYFPGLRPRLSFSNFMDAFFRKGKCSMRVFMVWNSPPWMFSVRHQRGLESLFFHHQDACVVVFSETIELNFFNDFVRDGFKIAVAMPNLDELLKDTPTHEFASVWFEWKKTKFYPIHYSELVRLAALYKYGGIYLDSDIKVLRPLHSLSNTVGLEDELSGSHLNGAVMVFRKHSPFIMECLMEFYASYDDTSLRWNGANLLTRVARKFLHEENRFKNRMELKMQPFFAFFPISRKNITRYFTPPATEVERAEQDVLFRKILNESLTFHFWNGLTYALVPEPESLVARLIDQHCIRCSDML